MAQWKCAGPITQRSEDQNLALLIFFSFFIISCLFCLFVDGHENNLSHELTMNQLTVVFFLSIINEKMRFILQLMFLFWP